MFDFKKKDNAVVNSAANSIKPEHKLATEQLSVGVLEVKYKKLHPEAVLPSYSKEGDAGMDLTAIDVHWDSEKQSFVYHTGLAVAVPEGYAMFIFPRSSNSKTNFYMPNHVGIVDSGYRGEVMVMFKHKGDAFAQQPYAAGDRVAQVVILPYPHIKPVFVDELSETERGTGGFGSTGS